MRGKIISCNANQKKKTKRKKEKDNEKEHNLQKEVKRLDLLASHAPIMKELLKTKHEPSNMLNKNN